MKALIDLLAGLVALLAAAALSQFGINLERPSAPLEVKRTTECTAAPADKTEPSRC